MIRWMHLFLAGVLAGCAPMDGRFSSDAPVRIVKTLSFTTTSPQQGAAHTGDDELYLVLGVIPGGLGGNPVQPSLAEIAVRIGGQGEVDLLQFESQVRKRVGTLDTGTMGEDFRVEPARLRFGRISNMLGVGSAETNYQGGGFFVPNTEVGVALVYVDRPASFSGRLVEDSTVIEYDVRLPAEGFHWIGYFPQPNDVVQVKSVEPPITPVEFRLLWSDDEDDVSGS